MGKNKILPPWFLSGSRLAKIFHTWTAVTFLSNLDSSLNITVHFYMQRSERFFKNSFYKQKDIFLKILNVFALFTVFSFPIESSERWFDWLPIIECTYLSSSNTNLGKLVIIDNTFSKPILVCYEQHQFFNFACFSSYFIAHPHIPDSLSWFPNKTDSVYFEERFNYALKFLSPEY